MNVVLGTIEHIPAIVSLNLLEGDRIVMQLAMNGLVLISLVGENLQERATATTGTPEYDWPDGEVSRVDQRSNWLWLTQHLAWSHHPLEAGENVA